MERKKKKKQTGKKYDVALVVETSRYDFNRSVFNVIIVKNEGIYIQGTYVRSIACVSQM